MEYGAERTSTLKPPERSIEELEQAARDNRGAERRQAMRDVAYAHLFAADEATEAREARRHRRQASRFANMASRGSSDDWLKAETDFVEVWSAWQADRPGAGNVAERFTRRHRTSGDLLMLAWIIRGEVAFEDEEWDEASEAFRYLLGSLDHPLYGYALYRTAKIHEARGNTEEHRQALREVVQLGCRDDALPENERVARHAQQDLGMPNVTLEDGTTLPEICAP